MEKDLLEMGYSVIRILDTDVVKDPEKAADEVEQAVRYKTRHGNKYKYKNKNKYKYKSWAIILRL